MPWNKKQTVHHNTSPLARNLLPVWQFNSPPPPLWFQLQPPVLQWPLWSVRHIPVSCMCIHWYSGRERIIKQYRCVCMPAGQICRIRHLVSADRKDTGWCEEVCRANGAHRQPENTRGRLGATCSWVSENLWMSQAFRKRDFLKSRDLLPLRSQTGPLYCSRSLPVFTAWNLTARPNVAQSVTRDRYTTLSGQLFVSWSPS